MHGEGRHGGRALVSLRHECPPDVRGNHWRLLRFTITLVTQILSKLDRFAALGERHCTLVKKLHDLCQGYSTVDRIARNSPLKPRSLLVFLGTTMTSQNPMNFR